jgi:cAMP-dependent protein kinase regulator
MSKSPASERGVSPLDRAHALRLLGQLEAALQLACSILTTSAEDIGAAYLVARLLLDAQRSLPVAQAADALLARFVRRGDLGGACLCAELVDGSGGDRGAALAKIAKAFGKGSARVGDASPRPPPLPAETPVTPALAKLSGAALLTAAETALARFGQSKDSVPDSTTLPRLPLFGDLPPPVLAKLLAALQVREYSAGKYVVQQGDHGREAFLLARGVLNVVRQDPAEQNATLAVLGPGALFGEMALVSNAPRAASVVAVEPAHVLVWQRSQLEELAQKDPTIGRELGQFCHQRMITNLIRHSRILSAVEPAKRHELVARFSTQTFQPGAVLVRQGQEAGSLFLIASGGVEVRSADGEGGRMVVAQPGPGDVVGEISLVLRRPATADVVAVHTTVALELTRDQFHAAIREHPGLLQELYEVATQREEETRSVVACEALDVSDNVLL